MLGEAITTPTKLGLANTVELKTKSVFVTCKKAFVQLYTNVLHIRERNVGNINRNVLLEKIIQY